MVNNLPKAKRQYVQKVPISHESTVSKTSHNISYSMSKNEHSSN